VVISDVSLVHGYFAEQLDALGVGARRAILARLVDGPLAVGSIARSFSISRPAVSQHLRVLKHADLVVDESWGSRRVYALNLDALESLSDYFAHYRQRAATHRSDHGPRRDENDTR
jgi:DNA-binding transcriptional ArsR family regulator